VNVVRTPERKMLTNSAKGVRPMPGRNDQDLIISASKHEAVFWTHDGPAAGLAKHQGLVVIDVVDSCAILVDRAVRDWAEINTRGAGLHCFAWRPDDLGTTIEATAARRPASPAVAAEFARRLGVQT
jgi:hypothetical protein